MAIDRAQPNLNPLPKSIHESMQQFVRRIDGVRLQGRAQRGLLRDLDRAECHFVVVQEFRAFRIEPVQEIPYISCRKQMHETVAI